MVPNNETAIINLTLTSAIYVMCLYKCFQLIFPIGISGRYCYYNLHLMDMETEA